MDAELYKTIVGGALALSGVFFGGLLTFLLEIFRRKWMITDRKYERRIEIIDARAEQAQKYAATVTEDFRNVMHDAEFFFVEKDPVAVTKRDENRRQVRDAIDNSIFSLGPAIGALGDSDLISHWDLMMRAMDNLNSIYKKAWKYSLKGDRTINPNEGLASLKQAWADYSGHLSDFYQRIDAIKLAASK